MKRNFKEFFLAEHIFRTSDDPIRKEKILQIFYKALKRKALKRNEKGGTKNDAGRQVQPGQERQK